MCRHGANKTHAADSFNAVVHAIIIGRLPGVLQIVLVELRCRPGSSESKSHTSDGVTLISLPLENSFDISVRKISGSIR